MKYRKKPVVVEAITFDELVEYGRSHGANIVNGMPWSFHYKGHPITHENDDCYLIPTFEGTMRLERGDMLITEGTDELYVRRPDIFAATYEAVKDQKSTADHVHCWHNGEVMGVHCCWCGTRLTLQVDETVCEDHGCHQEPLMKLAVQGWGEPAHVASLVECNKG